MKFPLAAFALILFPFPAFAQTSVIENNPMTFGKVVMTDNNAQKQIELHSNGTYTADPAFIFFDDPGLGSYSVTGYAPGTELEVTIATNTLNPQGGGGGPTFSIINTFTVPSGNLTVPGSGEVDFGVGGTLVSDGSGQGYFDDLYRATYSVTVSPVP